MSVLNSSFCLISYNSFPANQEFFPELVLLISLSIRSVFLSKSVLLFTFLILGFRFMITHNVRLAAIARLLASDAISSPLGGILGFNRPEGY